MLRKLLYFLFHTDSLDGEYQAKPGHVIYSLLIMGLGARFWFTSGLEWLGNFFVILGFLFGITILVCLNWDKSIAYWDKIDSVLTTLHKVNNPEVWKWAHLVFGVDVPDTLSKVTVKETEDKRQGSFSWKYHDISIPPNQMNMIANKVLGSGNTDLSETVYGSVIPNFRKIRKQWISEGILVPKNRNNVKNGYCLSRKGLQVMYNFASDHMKLKIEEK